MIDSGRMNRADHMAEERDAVWFPSEIDLWIGAVLALMPLLAIGAIVLAVVQGEGFLGAFITCLIVSAIYFGLIFPMMYGFADRHLIVRYGMMRQRIPYDEILSVRPTRNPLSSPALSMDRLRIVYGRGFFRRVMISPVRRESFLQILATRADLETHGDSLVRPGAEDT